MRPRLWYLSITSANTICFLCTAAPSTNLAHCNCLSFPHRLLQALLPTDQSFSLSISAHHSSFLVFVVIFCGTLVMPCESRGGRGSGRWRRVGRFAGDVVVHRPKGETGSVEDGEHGEFGVWGVVYLQSEG